LAERSFDARGDLVELFTGSRGFHVTPGRLGTVTLKGLTV
jgi:hypothetical protein